MVRNRRVPWMRKVFFRGRHVVEKQIRYFNPILILKNETVKHLPISSDARESDKLITPTMQCKETSIWRITLPARNRVPAAE